MLMRWLSRWLARYLSKTVLRRSVSSATYEAIRDTLEPGDVLLVEGDARISVAIRYLTQSTWSHAALYLGPDAGLPVAEDGEPHVLVEADLEAGIRSVPLSLYRHLHTRICRPVGISVPELRKMNEYVHGRMGNQYDLKNVVDLARYLLPTPPVPARYRRQLLSFGSGDPTRAICSTFLAQTFQQIRYPILPVRVQLPDDDPACERFEREYFRIRHHSLFVPRDFDVSPYFQVVKPTLEQGFNFRHMPWAEDDSPQPGDQASVIG